MLFRSSGLGTALLKLTIEWAKENAILEATIKKLLEPKKITTVVTDAPKVQGTQGLE